MLDPPGPLKPRPIPIEIPRSYGLEIIREPPFHTHTHTHFFLQNPLPTIFFVCGFNYQILLVPSGKLLYNVACQAYPSV